ncbi:hypothetical protein ACQR1I_14270 [Bradyrhizobium sp. HKCCYLS2038]|uniref:hypothetical protein n=1 Tax=unclassified Bradyrhizobium TaxID=2631580 RepID=UPI003EBB2FBE
MPKAKSININMRMSPPLTLAQFAAKSGLSIDAAAIILAQFAARGLAKVTDADRGLYRIGYTFRAPAGS